MCYEMDTLKSSFKKNFILHAYLGHSVQKIIFKNVDFSLWVKQYGWSHNCTFFGFWSTECLWWEFRKNDVQTTTCVVTACLNYYMHIYLLSGERLRFFFSYQKKYFYCISFIFYANYRKISSWISCFLVKN